MKNPRFATPKFRQTHKGLYICGINWGGRDDDAMAEVVRAQSSFFSDEAVPSYRYRRRIESWFRLWGFPLATQPETATDFEYCISQTNWLKDRSLKSEHRSNAKYLADHVDEFIEVLRARRPSVVLLFGSCLGIAVERVQLQLECELGPLQKSASHLFHERFPFTVRVFDFQRCTIIALPHPTGAVGTTDAQAKKCRTIIRKAFTRLPACPDR